MKPVDDFTAEQLVGRRVLFKGDPEHGDCWHSRVGITGGVVLRQVPSLAEKARLLASEGILAPGMLDVEAEVPRFWIHADPCSSFPRGCELAAERDCLVVLEAAPGAGPSS